ncbi:hypothetical protein HGB07_10280 [Candidatus Roizmanbacteria bacterium]|nr:hypothetical protein [Candidatus Roizmanbacteria bacterium]
MSLLVKLFSLIIFSTAAFWIGGAAVSRHQKGQVIGERTSLPTPTISMIPVSASSLLQESASKFQTIANSVASEAKQVTSQSAENVTDYVFQSTVGNVVKQIKKLPDKQQNEIKEILCK